MPECGRKLEYSLDLGAEASAPSTPQLGAAPPPRARNWRPAGQEREQQARSTAYDADGNLKVAMRWIYAPASTGLCPACDAPCVLPPSRPRSPSLSALTSASPFVGDANSLDSLSLRRPRTPSASRATSHSPPSSPLRPTGAGSVLVPSPSSAHTAEDELPPTRPKYTRPGADALVRLLSVLAALVLLLGVMSRKGGTEVAVVEIAGL
ncbi:hypothetical protein DFH06DRAFT_1326574 [Mycena polygramma]|nr:hypothetical protein DFH06DRAFT_1326574 [Mycena polygramma]